MLWPLWSIESHSSNTAVVDGFTSHRLNVYITWGSLVDERTISTTKAADSNQGSYWNVWL